MSRKTETTEATEASAATVTTEVTAETATVPPTDAPLDMGMADLLAHIEVAVERGIKKARAAAKPEQPTRRVQPAVPARKEIVTEAEAIAELEALTVALNDTIQKIHQFGGAVGLECTNDENNVPELSTWVRPSAEMEGIRARASGPEPSRYSTPRTLHRRLAG
jgi:hypothetical protein